MIKQFHLANADLLASFEPDHVYFQIEDQSVEVDLDEMREFYKELGDFLYPEKTIKVEVKSNIGREEIVRGIIDQINEQEKLIQ